MQAAALAALVAAVVSGAVAVDMVNRQSASQPARLSSVETQDVHALAFLGGSERVILGHHGGILESIDGGRTWTSWGTGSDAMALGVTPDERLVVAGHDVLAVGTPDGQWSSIDNDLPHSDIHGFARDPHDPDQMWAYLATGGVYESRDGGTHWEEVFTGHAFALLSTPSPGGTRLIAVDPDRRGIVASGDGGRSWELRGAPPTTPVFAMAAGAGGETLFVSGSEGLFRSDDGGRSFASLLDLGQPILAIAATNDGRTLMIAGRDRSIYRSDDGGLTWPSAP
ncbi:hypothetical protein BH23CHL6_BH23CHL6_09190 [soil metagenome]